MIEIKNFEITFKSYRIEKIDNLKVVYLEFWNLERDSGERALMTTQYAVNPDMNDFDAVRTAMRLAMEHEIDECLYLDGVRVNDPHKNKTSGLVIG